MKNVSFSVFIMFQLKECIQSLNYVSLNLLTKFKKNNFQQKFSAWENYWRRVDDVATTKPFFVKIKLNCCLWQSLKSRRQNSTLLRAKLTKAFENKTLKKSTCEHKKLFYSRQNDHKSIFDNLFFTKELSHTCHT